VDLTNAFLYGLVNALSKEARGCPLNNQARRKAQNSN
jgi:hypothetical protein